MQMCDEVFKNKCLFSSLFDTFLFILLIIPRWQVLCGDAEPEAPEPGGEQDHGPEGRDLPEPAQPPAPLPRLQQHPHPQPGRLRLCGLAVLPAARPVPQQDPEPWVQQDGPVHQQL